MPAKKIILEPLPSIEIPRQHIKNLGLRRRDGKFHALYFSQNKPLVVNNGKRCREIPTSKTVAFSRWLNDLGITLGEATNWPVVGNFLRNQTTLMDSPGIGSHPGDVP